MLFLCDASTVMRSSYVRASSSDPAHRYPLSRLSAAQPSSMWPVHGCVHVRLASRQPRPAILPFLPSCHLSAATTSTRPYAMNRNQSTRHEERATHATHDTHVGHVLRGNEQWKPLFLLHRICQHRVVRTPRGARRVRAIASVP